LALRYLHGDGIEIGALHGKLPVPIVAHDRYVDRFTVPALRAQYPELAELPLVEPDVIDDGEMLGSFDDGSLDFIAASHFIEHCQNPIGTIQQHLRKLRTGGILLLIVPDKRATFDSERALTTIEHLVRDDREGPAWSRSSHYREWVTESQRLTEGVDQTIARLEAQNYSIHFHVWTPATFLELLRYCRRDGMPFELQAFERSQEEFVIVLEKRES